MACSISIQSLLLARSTRISPPSPTLFLENTDIKCIRTKFSSGQREISRRCRAMVLQTAQGPSAAYAKEMERLSAKESLLLAFKEAGGFEAFVTGKTTNV